MKKLDKILKVIKHPKYILIALDRKNIIRLSDEKFLELQYENKMGETLDLENPKDFNQYIQWLKLNNRNPEYTKMVDKFDAKEYVSSIIGKEYIIPNLGVYDRFEDIDFDALPDKFVIKPTHTSGDVYICTDKTKIDFENLKTMINKWLKKNYYLVHREWPYKDIKPRIIIEEYMEDETGGLIDYKVFAFQGKCKYVMACLDRNKGETKYIYFDKCWNMKKEFSEDGIKYGDNVSVKMPKNLDKMFEFATILSKDIPFVRVDFYEVNGKLYFGELTFFPSAGFDNDPLNKMTLEELTVLHSNDIDDIKRRG